MEKLYLDQECWNQTKQLHSCFYCIILSLSFDYEAANCTLYSQPLTTVISQFAYKMQQADFITNNIRRLTRKLTSTSTGTGTTTRVA